MGIAGTRIVAAATAALAAAGLALPRQLEPGDRIGGMTLVQMAYADSIPSIFPACEPLILRPGLYHRHCTVRQTRRLFIGYGDFRATRPALDRAWRRERWRLRVDGHEVRLAAFGTDDRTLLNYPPGAYRNSLLREWRVVLVHPTRGRHLIRYVTREGNAVTDVTFTVTVD